MDENNLRVTQKIGEEWEELYSKQVENLIMIYEEEDFELASKYEYPYRPKMSNYDISRRYEPRVFLGFGKYPERTLYEVYLIDRDYFQWIIDQKILQFGRMETSPKVEYSKNHF